MAAGRAPAALDQRHRPDRSAIATRREQDQRARQRTARAARQQHAERGAAAASLARHRAEHDASISGDQRPATTGRTGSAARRAASAGAAARGQSPRRRCRASPSPASTIAICPTSTDQQRPAAISIHGPAARLPRGSLRLDQSRRPSRQHEQRQRHRRDQPLLAPQRTPPLSSHALPIDNARCHAPLPLAPPPRRSRGALAIALADAARRSATWRPMDRSTTSNGGSATGLTPYPRRARRDGGARRRGPRRRPRASCVWLLEHPPLFTAGTSADPAELFNPLGFPVYRGRARRALHLSRPGPAGRLSRCSTSKGAARDIRRFVHALEGWMIAALGRARRRGAARAGADRHLDRRAAPTRPRSARSACA